MSGPPHVRRTLPLMSAQQAELDLESIKTTTFYGRLMSSFDKKSKKTLARGGVLRNWNLMTNDERRR